MIKISFFSNTFCIFCLISVLVVSSGCPPPVFPLPSGDLPAYAEVGQTLDGGYTPTYQNKLYFRYKNEYGESLLTYRILNKQNAMVLSNATQPVALQAGVHGHVLNVSSIVNGSDYFILEITNAKKEKWYLRFK